MDTIDRRIVGLLQANARLTYQELGAGVGLSAAAAFQRVRKLEESGTITGYHARIAEEARGASVVAVLRLEPAAGAHVERLLDAWQTAGGVEACYRMAGGAVLARVRAAGIGDLEPYVTAARGAGCAVHAEFVSATVFERWALPVEPAKAG